MDNVDIRLLRIFLVLMDERSVSVAASRLGLSQPATSHALGRLRDIFNDPLLVRSRNSMVMTDRARALESSIRELLATYDGLLVAATDFDASASKRTFIISAPELGEHILVPPLIAKLRAEAPNIRIEIRAPDPDKSYELMELGEVDLRVAWLTKPSASLRSLPLFHDRIVCIAASNHPTVRGSLSLEQFIRLPQLRTLSNRHSYATTSLVIDEALARHGLRLERPFLVQSYWALPATVINTDVIATVPYTLAVMFNQHYAMQTLEPPLELPTVSYSAFWHERCHHDAGHRWLRLELQHAAQRYQESIYRPPPAGG